MHKTSLTAIFDEKNKKQQQQQNQRNVYALACAQLSANDCSSRVHVSSTMAANARGLLKAAMG